jgi:hypothetical protein
MTINPAMMRYLSIVLMMCSILACNNNSTEYGGLIKKFEKILGENESYFLNEIVSDFDNYLILNYPENESEFKAYLEAVSEMKVKNNWKIDSLKLKKYRESNIFSNYDSIYPDSVWFEDGIFKITYTDYFCEELITSSEEWIPSKSDELRNIDSTINSLQREPILTKYPSNFIVALDSIQQTDSLIITYLDFKNWVDDISPENLAGGLLYFLSEENEYFAKRIFVMEILD